MSRRHLTSVYDHSVLESFTNDWIVILFYFLLWLSDMLVNAIHIDA